MKSSDYTRMLQMIDSEDAKNPYTDQELAEHLKLSRSSVTTMRKKQVLKIPENDERLFC